MARSLISRILLVGCLAAALLPLSGTEAAPTRPAGQGVVALIDTGINPYHVTFHDDSPLAQKHPSTYIPDYPKSAIPLRLSLHEPEYWGAVQKDCRRVWSKVRPGRLYWFPGTKIVGAITFDPRGNQLDCESPQPSADGRILDAEGHGTISASRAASNEYGACPGCRLVAVQTGSLSSKGAMESIGWAAENARWIDAQSNSWGPLVPAWEPTGQSQLITSNPQIVRKVEKTARAHLAFWASGNGAADRGGAIGHPTLLTPHLGPSAIIVGGHDSGYVNTWPGFPPHLVADSCASWAAYAAHTERSAEDLGDGTSAATPFAAGGAARILLEARRILGDRGTGVHGKVVARGPEGVVAKGPLSDGRFTLEEWKRVLFTTASPRPKGQKEDGPPCGALDAPYNATPVKWSDVPDGYPEYLHIGYGAIDKGSMALALGVLTGKDDMPDRSQTDQFFELDGAARAALYEVWSKP